MTWDYEVLTSGGDTYYADQIYRVFLYPDDGIADDFVDDGAIQRGAKQLCEQLLNYGTIDAYSIYRWTGGYFYDCPDGPYDARSTMRDKIQYHDLYYTGSHMLACSRFTNGAAETAHQDGDTAFSREKAGAIGTDGAGGTDLEDAVQTKNLTIHECTHTIIREDIYRVQELVNETGAGDELDEVVHALGQVNDANCSIFYGTSTPFIIGYEPSLAGEGDCTNAGQDNCAYTTEMTSCTKWAIDESQEAEP